MTTRILLIDKEATTFDDFKEKLSSAGDQWVLETCTDPKKVLKLIKAKQPEIVICAHRPSVIDGVKVLKSIAAKLPHIERFILAEEAEKGALDPEIGSSFHFLPSPCPENTLQLELQRVVNLNNWLGKDKIKEIVGSVRDFPSLPPVYMKVVNAVNSPNASVESIAEIIMADIAVTAKILQTVNSSFFGLEEKVSDIAQAVSILGIESVKNIVLAVQAFEKIEDPDQQALVDQLWRHSMSVAIAAKRITKHETDSEKKAEEAYTAGLFHDIGKLVLLKSSPEDYGKARELAAESEISQWEAEEKTFGCNHAEVGAYLLGRWGLPVSIIESAALHHKPSESFNSEFTILTAIHVANAIVRGRGKSENPHPDAAPNEEYLAEIGRVGSWEDWENVSVGKTPASKQSPDSNSQSKSGAGVHSADTSAAAVSSSGGSNSRKNNLIIITAIAATLAIGIGMIFSDSDEEAESVANASDDWEAGSFYASAEEAAPIDVDELETQVSEEVENTLDERLIEGAESDVASVDSSSVDDDSLQTEETVLADSEEETLEVVSKVPKIRLTGIFYNDSNPLASINGKLLRKGDIVEGAKILSIEKQFVTVSYNGENMQIDLPKIGR